MLSRHEQFVGAVPVWAKDRTREMNLSLVFTLPAVLKPGRTYELAVTASSVYMAFCGGELLSVGPARAGHGYYRVDRLKLPAPDVSAAAGEAQPEPVELKIIVAGYNVNSFAYLDMPAFLCAELTEDGCLLGRTAPDADNALPAVTRFTARVYTERIRKLQRYSFQRTFAEAYDLRRAPQGTAEYETVPLAAAAAGIFLERGVPEADFSPVRTARATVKGTARRTVVPEDRRRRDRVIGEPRDNFKCFPLKELEVCTAWEAQGFEYGPPEPAAPAPDGAEVPDGGGYPILDGIEVPDGSYLVLDLGREYTGMIGFEAETDGDTDVYVLESEILTGGRADGVDFLRLGDSDLVKWTLPKGRHRVLSFEPYSFRYAKLVVFGGNLKLRDFVVRRYCHAPIDRQLPADVDSELRAIFDAAVETFRQNAVDIYMDCPSRERAGWLCDSFFTSRTERCLTGESRIERNFLENFLLPDSFACLPEGMLPMCYPSDHYDGVFIPTWAMWYVLELGEYFKRTGDRELTEFARQRIYGLIAYLNGFANEFGLLEKLPSWVFIEWSRSNELVMDVNFPLNFLYARVLCVAGELYGDNTLTAQGEQLLRTASVMSYTGRFFCDNAYRRGGRLVLSGECTECCQYYAFYFGAADADSHPELFRILCDEFGPGREARGTYPEIALANAFIGNYLRLDWLMRLGLTDKVRDNIRGYFLQMANQTGTLWEHQKSVASCNHGFASHVAVWLSAIYGLGDNKG